MKNNVVFTRSALREIAPDLTRKQEDALIDLYLEASKRFKKRMNELESQAEDVANTLSEIVEIIRGKRDEVSAVSVSEKPTQNRHGDQKTELFCSR